MALNTFVDSFLPRSEKCGTERVKQNLTLTVMIVLLLVAVALAVCGSLSGSVY